MSDQPAKVIRRKVRLKITSGQTIRIRGRSLNGRCPVCQRDVELLTPVQAVQVLEIDGPTFSHFLSSGLIHSVHMVSGTLMVCKESLFLR